MPTPLRGLQVFHWLVSDRVEYLETTPAGSRLQHIRIVAFMILLLVRTLAFLRCPSACSRVLRATCQFSECHTQVVRLQVIDAAFLQLTVSKTLQRSASVHLLFAFEYVIQVCFAMVFSLAPAASSAAIIPQRVFMLADHHL